MAMDTNLLRSWLGLPPGAWPPPDRMLLGMPEGPIEVAVAERRAMELMGKLRHHQLLHPELVTEGMNRLAQAMLAVTTAMPSRVTAPQEAVTIAITVQPNPAQTPSAPTAIPSLSPSPIDDKTIVAASATLTENFYEPIDLSPKSAATYDMVELTPQPAGVAKAVGDSIPTAMVAQFAERPGGRFSPTEASNIEVALPVVTPDVLAWKQSRREAYRELAGLRAILHVWQKFQVSIASPSAYLATPADVCDFLEAVFAYRELRHHHGVDFIYVQNSAPLIDSILKQRLPLAFFRSLTLSQRNKLAQEWANSRYRFLARAGGIRQAVGRNDRPAGYGRRQGWQFWINHPEWVLLTLTLIFSLLLYVRWNVR